MPPTNLPAPVFIRGFIRAYCQALGESPEEALAIYEGREVQVVASRARRLRLRDARTTAAAPRTRGASWSASPCWSSSAWRSSRWRS